MPGRTHSRECALAIVRQVANGSQRPAQICREHNLDESVLCARARSTTHTARRPARRGKGPSPRASIKRHALITAAHAAHPEISRRRLCALFGINQAWYYRHRRKDPVVGEVATRERSHQALSDF